jgi:hypothetical protein
MMAGKFVLTAQMQLQAPTNTAQVVSQINRQLQNVRINPQINTKNMTAANKQMTNLNTSAITASNSLGKASKNAQSLGASLGAAARRFAAITLATGFFLGLTRAMGDAVGKAIEFERELLKISQVTGKTVQQLSGLTNEVTKLSTSLGASSSELLNAARTLSQAGFAANKVTGALRVLAQTDLAATFDNIADTTEGAVAILRQFRKEVASAGGEVKFLEQALDAINAVSKNFAVESKDLIAVVRRTGGVFEAAGGKLNELIALFTSVRGTTRETAETIATGFRTIFTRIQRTETIDQLKELGIVLQDSTGKFVGPLQAIEALSVGLASLDPRDFRFNQIVEQLGGFRQVGKVIPLIKQYATSGEALAIANNAMGSTAEDAQTAQQGLGVQIEKLGEKFNALFRKLTDSNSFRSFAEGAIQLAEAFLRVVDALEPLLPMLAKMAAFRLGQMALPAFGKFAGITGKNQGGRIHAFNSGGMVPGSGNRDTVPAMMTPGEFVLRKSAVKSIGAGNLAKMNGYAAGGRVALGPQQFGMAILDASGPQTGGSVSLPATNSGQFTDQKLVSRLNSYDSKYPDSLKQGRGAYKILAEMTAGNKMIKRSGPSKTLQDVMNKGIDKGLMASVDKAAQHTANNLSPAIKSKKLSGTAAGQNFIKSINPSQRGLVFEGLLDNLIGEPFDTRPQDPNRPFDFLNGMGQMSRHYKTLADLKYVDAKKSLTQSQPAKNKQKVANQLGLLNVGNVLREMKHGKKVGAQEQKKMKGPKGSGGTGFKMPKGIPMNAGGVVDNVPAMLTPGEYVMSKASAQKIGYGTLERMNRGGIAGYNSGGIVQGYNVGGVIGMAGAGKGGARAFKGMGAQGMSQFASAAPQAAQSIAKLAQTTNQAQTAMITYSRAIVQGSSPAVALGKATEALNLSTNKMAQAQNKSSTQMSAAGQKYAQSLTQSQGPIKAAMAKMKQIATMPVSGMIGGGVTKMGAGMKKAGGAMSNAAGNAMMAGFVASMVLEMDVFKTALGDAGTAVAQQLVMLAPMLMMMAGPILTFVGSTITATAAKIAETGVTSLLTAAKGAELLATVAMAAPLILLAGIGIALAANFMYLKEVAKQTAEEAKKMGEEMASGEGATGDVGADTARLKATFKKANEAASEAADGGWWGSLVDGATAFGAGLLDVTTGGMAGATGAYIDHKAALKQSKDSLRNDLMASTNAAAASLAIAANASNSFNDALTEMAQKEMDASNALDHLSSAGNRLVGSFDQAQAEYLEAQRKLAQAEANPNATEDELKVAREGAENAAKGMEALQKDAAKLSSIVRGQQTTAIEDMIKAGKTAAQVLADPKIKRGYEQVYQANVRAKMASLMSADSTMSKARAEQQAQQYAAGIMKAQQKKDAEVLKAADERRIADAQAAMAARKLAFEAIKAERALAKLSGTVAAMNVSIQGFESIMAAAIGEFKEFNPALGEAIDTLSGGTVTKAGATALKATGSSVGLGGTADNLIKTMRSNEALRSKLIKDGMTEFRKGGDKAGTASEAEDFLKRAGFDLSGMDETLKGEILSKFQDGLDLDEVNEIFEMLNDRLQPGLEAFKQMAEVLNTAQASITAATGKLIDAKKKERAAVMKLVDVQFKGFKRLMKAQGKEVTSDMVRANTTAKVRTAVQGTGAGPDVASISAARQNFQRLAQQSAAGAANTTDANVRMKLTQQQQFATEKARQLGEALESLTDQSELAAAVMADIEKEQAKRAAVQESIKEFTFATNEGRMQMMQEFSALNRVLQTGNINTIPDKFRGAVGKLLDQFKDIKIFGGQTGGEVSKQLQIGEMDRMMRMMSGGRQGVTPQMIKQIMESTTKEDKLIADLKALGQDEVAAQQAIVDQQANNVNNLVAAINNMVQRINSFIMKAKGEVADANIAVPKASGGLIYRAGGGSIFKPRGTDTVPAMLTPGEFVIKKSAVDKIGVGALSALNNGNANTVYKAGGGFVAGGNTEQDAYVSGQAFARSIALGAVSSRNWRMWKNKQDGLPGWFEKYVKDYGHGKRSDGIFNVAANAIGSTGFLGNPRFGLGRLHLTDPNNGPNINDSAQLTARAGGLLQFGGGKLRFNPGWSGKEALLDPALVNAKYNDMSWFPSSLQIMKNKNAPSHLKQQAQETRQAWAMASTGVNPSVPWNRMTVAGTQMAMEMNKNNYWYKFFSAFAPDFLSSMATLNKLSKLKNNRPVDAARGAKISELAGIESIPRFAKGGSVDSVPAMLTPGEFVMNKGAVQKHGLSAMKALNKGKVPGFNRGGFVGGVQYRQGGGSVQGNQMLMQALDGLAQALPVFTNVANLLQGIANSFSNLQVTHNVNVSGTLAIPGFSQEAITTLVQLIGSEVTLNTRRQINKAVREFRQQQDQRAD